MSPVLLFVAFAGLAVGMWWFSSLLERQRREMLAAWAGARGLRFDPSAMAGAPSGLGGFALLDRGRRRAARHRSQGQVAGASLTVFDWSYVTGDGKHSQTHRCTAIHLQPPCPLAGLRIREEGFLDRLGELVGFNDIDFESAAFSRAFHVTADERRWAYDVITAPTMELLLASPRFSIEMRHNGLLLWRDRRLDPPQIDAAIALGQGILRGIHPAVRRQLGLAS